MVGYVGRLFYSTGQVASQLGVSLNTGVDWASITRFSHRRRTVAASGASPPPRSCLSTLALTEPFFGLFDLALNPAPFERASGDGYLVLCRQNLNGKCGQRLRLVLLGFDRQRARNRRQPVAFQALAATLLEREKTLALRAKQRRHEWLERWMKYALDSVPDGARNEFVIEVHAAVSKVLKALPSSESDITTRRLVDAAVHQVLRPWQRKVDRQRALDFAMDRLPWDVRMNREWARLKEHALDTAAASIQKLGAEASYRQMAAVAEQAVQPVILSYEHWKVCSRIADNVYLFDTTAEERKAAQQTAFMALMRLPVTTPRSDLEKAKEAALAPYKTAVAQRKETARLESEQQARRNAAAWRVEGHLAHIERYARRAYDLRKADLREGVDRLRPVIRETLIERVLKNPQMTDAEIRAEIEKQVDQD